MTLLAVVAIAGVAAPLLQATIHPYLTATRDLRLTAIDAKLAPPLAQFRVRLRMIAAALQAAVHPGSTSSRDLPMTAVDDKQSPQLALFDETVDIVAAASQAAVHGRFASFIAWGFFP